MTTLTLIAKILIVVFWSKFLAEVFPQNGPTPVAPKVNLAPAPRVNLAPEQRVNLAPAPRVNLAPVAPKKLSMKLIRRSRKVGIK